MKKFLSLLLALTLVLSLVVVPARADETGYTVKGDLSVSANNTTVDSGTAVTLRATDNVTVSKDDTDSEQQPEFTHILAWSGDGITDADKAKNELTVNPTNLVEADAVKTYTCTLTIKDGDTVIATRSDRVSVTVVSAQGKANAAFKSAIATVTYNGRNYLEGDKVTAYKFTGETTEKWDATLRTTASNYKLAKSAVVFDSDAKTITVNGIYTDPETKAETNVTAVFKGSTLTLARVTVTPASSTILSGGNVLLTADAKGFTDAKYAWYTVADGKPDTPVNRANSDTLGVKLTNDTDKDVTYKYKCKVTNGAGGNAPTVESNTVTITVKPAGQYQLLVTAEQDGLLVDNSNIVLTNSTKKVEFGSTLYTTSGNKPAPVPDDGVTYGYDVSGTKTAFDTKLGKNGDTLTVSLKSGRSGSITVTPYATYMGLTVYGTPKTYTISSNNLSATLPTSVENGSSITLYTKSSDRHEDANLALVAQKVLRDKVSDGLRVTEATIKEARSTTTSVTGGKISKLSSQGTYTFTADRSSLTPAEMTIVATAGGSQYEIKLTIPVTPIMGTNFESVTAEPVSSTATTTSYRVYFPTTYTNYYVVNTSGSTPGSWSSSMVSGKGYNYNTPYPLSASNFNNANGTCTLYVIAKDGVNGNYYGGQMTVSLTNYDIKYSVVAGKDVTFSQKDFDSFVKEYAKNRGDWTTASRKDYPYVEFDHAELSTIPTAKTEGTLYYKGSEVTASSNRNAEYADLDRMTFESASKPTRDTVTLRFSLVCKKYSSASDKGSTVTYPVNVVISIVKEDITYTVGIDDSVSVKVSDFVNFLQDAKTSYRKSTLDYVKFDVSGKNVSSYAYGGLYRSYSSYSTGKLADSTDKFYYEPSRTQYDLADVAYHTTRWAEAGKTVYIPFTVYGTKGEEASGTMAITIAQTMNFIDVKASDFFYEPVKWAVNNKITNGTSSTTFSPYKNCNRAEIVTFLWRAAGSPEPTVTRNPFKDVNAVTHSSYYKAILWASQKGITAGTTATTFSPYQECTRSQIVTFLYRYAGKPSGYYSNPFKDVSSVNEASYYNAILWAVGKGITQGTSTTTFSPYASCTRGEAVTFLYRYVNGVK